MYSSPTTPSGPVTLNLCEVEDTETIHYEFEFNANIYELVYKNDIGQVANMPLGAVVREITLKKKS